MVHGSSSGYGSVPTTVAADGVLPHAEHDGHHHDGEGRGRSWWESRWFVETGVDRSSIAFTLVILACVFIVYAVTDSDSGGLGTLGTNTGVSSEDSKLATLVVRCDSQYTSGPNREAGTGYAFVDTNHVVVELYQRVACNVLDTNGEHHVEDGSLVYEWTYQSKVYQGPTLHLYLDATALTQDSDGDASADIPVSVAAYPATAMDRSRETMVSYGSTSLLPRYVRRSIADLSDADREAFLRVLETYYRTSPSDGRELYGDDFMSASDFVAVHHSLSASTDCDHLHDGLGYVPRHLALTTALEQQLQKIDPSVALHYWDFIASYEAADQSVARMLEKDSIFAADNFGLGFETPARWDNLRLQDTAQSSWVTTFSVAMNARGLSRAPWNTNDSPYVQRFSNQLGDAEHSGEDLGLTWPSCERVEDMAAHSTWAALGVHVEGTMVADAPTLLAGAVSGSNVFDTFSAALSDTTVDQLRSIYGSTAKSMYMHDQLKCTAEAGCICTEMARRNPQGVLYRLSSQAHSPLTDVSDWASMSTIAVGYCSDQPLLGDQMSSAAPNDPIFWVMQGVVAKVLQRAIATGQVTDWSWPTEPHQLYRGDVGSQSRADPLFTCAGHAQDSTISVPLRRNALSPVETEVSNEALVADYLRQPAARDYVYDSLRFAACDEKA